MGSVHTVAKVADVPPGTGICVEVEGLRLALFNVEGAYYAIDDECPHSGAPLSEGDLDGCQVICPWHNAAFDLTDGSVQCPPAEEGVTAYRVTQEGDDLQVELP